MTMIRERRHKKALRLSLPAPVPSGEFRNNVSSTSSSSSTLSPLSSTSSNSTSNDSVSDLEKLAVIGHGHGSTVYKVRHKHSSTLFGLKVLRFDEGAMAIQQAAREAEILKRVDSQFTVRCYGVFDNEFADTDTGGDLCFIMEYMEAGSLLDILSICRRLPEKLISGIARRVLEGLHYLHGMQIVHRDIKPSNLLINSKGEIKIADFGVSRLVTGIIEECKSNLGTYAYMSPERFDPEKWNGNCCDGYAGDVWSLGVVVLECFLGRFPLIEVGQKLDWAALMCAICFGEKMAVPDTASPEFKSFVWRCLERDWTARGTVEELLDHPFVTKCGTAGSLQELMACAPNGR